MPKRSKVSARSRATAQVSATHGSGVPQIVEGLLGFLNRHQGDRRDGVHALLVAFVQAGIQVLQDCDNEEIEANRDTLLKMLEQARLVLNASETAQPASRMVH
jgi:hypothetical protein